MRNMVHLSSLDGERIAIDSDSIIGILEMRASKYKTEDGHVIDIPGHVLILISGIQFKIKGTYDEVINNIKEQEYNNNLGI